MEKLGSTRIPWNKETVYALGLYRIIGSVLGIWPLNCNEHGSKFRFCTVMIMQISMNYTLIKEIASGCVSSAEFIQVIHFITANTVGLVKIIVIRIYEKKMCSIVESAVGNWSIVSDDDKTQLIMRRNAQIGKFIGICHLSTAYSSIVIYVIAAPPMFGSVNFFTLGTDNDSILIIRNYPMPSGCSMIGIPDILYLPLYITEFVQIINVVTCTIGTDVMFFGLTMHICAQIETLKVDIVRMGDQNDSILLKENIVVLVKRHNDLVNLINFMEDVFNVIILGVLVAASILICCLGLQMLIDLQNSNYFPFVHWLMVVIAVSFEMFLYSFSGDYLASQMQELLNAVYSTKWYNFSPSIRKDIMFVIMRCNDRFHLTAGKLYRMNIPNFTRILKTMVSFFSVAKLMLDKNTY